MKNLILILLASVTISCSAQNIDKVTGYDTTSVDHVIDSLKNEIVLLEDSITTVKNYYDSLILNATILIFNDTLVLEKDTFDLKIISPTMVYVIEKEGFHNAISLGDTNNIRIRLDYNFEDVDLWIQDSIFTRHSSHTDLR